MPQKYRITTDQGTFEVTTEDSPQQQRQPLKADAENSWRGSADPEGAMALAGIANEQPMGAAMGATAGLLGPAMGPGMAGGALAGLGRAAGMIRTAAPSMIKGAASGGLLEFIRSGGDIGSGLRGAAAGAVSGPILKSVGGHLAEGFGTGMAKGMAKAGESQIQKVASPGLGKMLIREATPAQVKMVEESALRNQLLHELSALK